MSLPDTIPLNDQIRLPFALARTPGRLALRDGPAVVIYRREREKVEKDDHGKVLSRTPAAWVRLGLLSDLTVTDTGEPIRRAVYDLTHCPLSGVAHG